MKRSLIASLILTTIAVSMAATVCSRLLHFRSEMNIVLKFVRLFTAEAQRALRRRREGRRNAPPPFSATPRRPLRLCGEKHRILFLYLSIATTFVAQMFSPQAEAGRLSQQITFNKHVAPIFFANCAACHHAGGAGPFGLI